ncbi:hypothetical protein C8Q74DRAFT_62440 [Fomes fomentarius]|nr:hypothetical protein C8Q74DRAFT_62440 [Fomes fomentarius]
METNQGNMESYISGIRFNNMFVLMALTIRYYDYAITLTSEIEYYWNPPSLSVSFILFFVNRYVAVLGSIPVFSPYFMGSSQPIYAILSQVIVGVLLTLRTYALYNCSKRMLAALVGMYTLGMIQAMSAFLLGRSPLKTTEKPIFGFEHSACVSLTHDQGFRFALAWSAMLWFDTVVFILTFYKAIQMRHERLGGLLATMIRDGTVYFAVLVVVHTVNIVALLGSNDEMRGAATTITNVFSATLTSRLLLNLRDPRNQVRLREGATTRGTQHEGWSAGQFSSRMMSFQTPPTSSDTFEMEESQSATDSLVTSRKD